MAVAFDVATFDAITGDDSIVHTPSGAPRAVVVLIVQAGSAADLIAAVTYGGEDVPQVVRAADAVGEAGSAYGFFLGAGIPTGEQTVAIDVSSGTEPKAVWVLTFTAAGDCELVAVNVTEGDADDPSTILGTPSGFVGMVAAALFSGLGLPSNSDAGAGYTPLAAGADPDGHDFGVNTANAMHGAQAGANVVANWTTTTPDDVALAALALQEAAAGDVTETAATSAGAAHTMGEALVEGAASVAAAGQGSGEQLDEAAVTTVADMPQALGESLTEPPLSTAALWSHELVEEAGSFETATNVVAVGHGAAETLLEAATAALAAAHAAGEALVEGAATDQSGLQGSGEALTEGAVTQLFVVHAAGETTLVAGVDAPGRSALLEAVTTRASLSDGGGAGRARILDGPGFAVVRDG